MATIELKISGMTCDHCVHAVTNALSDIEGVSSAEVDLDEGRAVVQGAGVDVEKLLKAVEEEGYEASIAASAT